MSIILKNNGQHQRSPVNYVSTGMRREQKLLLHLPIIPELMKVGVRNNNATMLQLQLQCYIQNSVSKQKSVT